MLAVNTIEPAFEDGADATADREAPPASAVAAVDGEPPPFSPLELLVIGIGERDRPVRLRPGGRLARVGRALFGVKAPSPFADRRLEALRSLANALRHGRGHSRGPGAAVAAALANGITPRQIETLKTRNRR